MRFRTQMDVTTAHPGRHSDAHKSGLYLIVSADRQNRRWAFRYTKPTTGKVTEIGLGSANVLTLTEARDKAHEHRRTVVKGGDPIEKRREEQRACTTFAEVVQAYLAVKRSGWRTKRYPVRIERLLTRYAKALSGMAISKITPADIERALSSLWQRYPLQGRRVLSMISQVFDFAMAKDLTNGVNPAEWRRMKYRFPRVRSVAHFTALSYEQVPGFVQQLHAVQATEPALSPYAIEFLLLTACRTGEVIGMKWQEVDFDTKVWTVPAARAKSAREHRVPLCERALELLNQQHQRRTNEYIWRSRDGKGHISEKALYLFVVRTMKVPVTIHGFRSSFRDFAGCETSADRITAELCLAHRAGDATELAYRRSDALAKRRLLMEAWASYCEGAPTTGNVLEFRPKISALG